MSIVPNTWQVIEPEDNSDAVAHRVSRSGSLNGWNIAAASVRGRAHAHTGGWREDAFEIRACESWTVIAIADGFGGRQLSRVGASIACQATVAFLESNLPCSEVAWSEGEIIEPHLREALCTLMVGASLGARDAIAREAAERRMHARDFNTQLLIGIHRKQGNGDLVGGAHIGLGMGGAELHACTDDGVVHRVVSAKEEDGSVYSVCEANESIAALCSFVHLSGITQINAMSDGVANDYWDRPSALAVDILSNGVVPICDGSELRLLSWLDSYSIKGSHDDRTLIVLRRR